MSAHNLDNCPLCGQEHFGLPVQELPPPYFVIDDQEFRFYVICPATDRRVYFVTKIEWVGETKL